MRDVRSMIGERVRLRNEISGDIEETTYTIEAVEEDNEIPDLIWFYLVSEYGDENTEYEAKYNLYYAKITNNLEGLLV